MSADTSAPRPAVAPPAQQRHVNGYATLARAVGQHGLLRRRYGFYWTRILATVALVPAAVLGLVSTQFGFLGHDLAHRQAFSSTGANEWGARVVAGLFAGLSYTWWMGKHNAHHRTPNQEGTDPDIGPGVLAFTPAAAATRTGVAAWFTRRQGWAFFPLLTPEGLSLHVESVRTVLADTTRDHRWVELVFIAVRLGGSFAPNQGMPIVAAYCTEHQIPCTETSLTRSYGIVVRYLNAVGLAERDPFHCPLVRQYRA